MNQYNRREFLLFLGRSAAVAGISPLLVNCQSIGGSKGPRLPFHPLEPSFDDDLKLAKGFSYQIVARWRQPLNQRGDRFGFNNDYIAYLPFKKENPDEGLMWVNHEYHDPYYCSGWKPGEKRTAKQMEIERKEVGGSILHIRKTDGRWTVVENSSFNRRLDAYTPIPLISDRPILGHKKAIGTFANCAGGVTPWGTVLTCEENYDNFVGEAVFENGRRQVKMGSKYGSWLPFTKLPPEHYGWVVEVDLRTGKAKKLCALGRFAHECATCVQAPDGRTVVYSGDDTEGEHIYKFISLKPGSLEVGDLYVADTVNGRWIPLARRTDERLRKAFKDHTELLIRTREAAKIVGATPLDRPEDIEFDPISKNIFVALTNGRKSGNHFGSIMKIAEKGDNPLSLEFTATTFAAGGPSTGFSCPDNLAFDRAGNLWMTTDMSGSSMGKEPYKRFGNNGLFFFPMSGPHAGQAFQVASAPNGAELTGPYFSPDGRTLFLSVQHPGEWAQSRPEMVSHWPDGGDATPAPCVVAISGSALDEIIGATV